MDTYHALKIVLVSLNQLCYQTDTLFIKFLDHKISYFILSPDNFLL